MPNLVGKVIFATHTREVVPNLIPFLVIEQSTFALTAVNARGGVHSIHTVTLNLNGPSRWEIVCWHEQPDLLVTIISNLETMLDDKDFNLTEGTVQCARLTLDRLYGLRTSTEAAFFNQDLGEEFPADIDSLGLGDDEDGSPVIAAARAFERVEAQITSIRARHAMGEEIDEAEFDTLDSYVTNLQSLIGRFDDSEDESRAAGEAAATVREEQRELDSILSQLLTRGPQITGKVIVVRVRSPVDAEQVSREIKEAIRAHQGN